MDDRSLWGNQFWMYLPRDYWGRIICGEMWKGFGWVHWIDINTKEESPKDIIVCIAWLRHCLLGPACVLPLVLDKSQIYLCDWKKGFGRKWKQDYTKKSCRANASTNVAFVVIAIYTNTSTQSCPTNASTNAAVNALIAPQMNQPRAVMTNASTNGVNAVTSMHQHLWEPHFART